MRFLRIRTAHRTEIKSFRVFKVFVMHTLIRSPFICEYNVYVIWYSISIISSHAHAKSMYIFDFQKKKRTWNDTSDGLLYSFGDTVISSAAASRASKMEEFVLLWISAFQILHIFISERLEFVVYEADQSETFSIITLYNVQFFNQNSSFM